MMATENQEMKVYAPRSNVFGGILMGIMGLSLGIICLLLADGHLIAFLLSFLFILGGIWLGPFFVWKLLRNPILIINNEGIREQHPFSHAQIKWNEIDSIYGINYDTAFAIDLSPTGLRSYFSRQGRRIPRRWDTTVPQQVLIIQAINLPLPIDQLLAQIREHFSLQLEHYHIDLDDKYEESQEIEE
jgi:hypothetical protein